MPKNGRPNVKGGNHLIPYSSTKEKLLQELASTEEGGLTEDRVRERLEKYGPNKLREKKKKTKYFFHIISYYKFCDKLLPQHCLLLYYFY